MKKTGQVKIDLAERLHIPGSKAVRYLKTAIGDEVSLNQVLAEKRSLLRKKHVKSPCEGRVVGLFESGILVIKPLEKTDTVSRHDDEIKGILDFFNRIQLVDINASHIGHIIICVQSPGSDLIYKADALGVKGLVFLVDKEQSWPVAAGLTIKVLVLPKNKYLPETIKSWQGQSVMIKGKNIAKEIF